MRRGTVARYGLMDLNAGWGKVREKDQRGEERRGQLSKGSTGRSKAEDGL